MARLVLRGVPSGELFPEAGRLVRVDARPADLANQEPAGRQGTVTNLLHGEAMGRTPGQPLVVRVLGQPTRIGHRGLAVGRREHHLPKKGLQVPARTRRMSWPASRPAPGVWAVAPGSRSCPASAPGPGRRRAPNSGSSAPWPSRGCSGSRSHLASPSRSGGQMGRKRADGPPASRARTSSVGASYTPRARTKVRRGRERSRMDMTSGSEVRRAFSSPRARVRDSRHSRRSGATRST